GDQREGGGRGHDIPFAWHELYSDRVIDPDRGPPYWRCQGTATRLLWGPWRRTTTSQGEKPVIGGGATRDRCSACPSFFRGLPVPDSYVVVSALSFSWPDDTPVFDDLSFSVPGGRTGLVAANGAGKSTLLKLVAGELRPASGSVTVEGVLGYLPQHLPFAQQQ